MRTASISLGIVLATGCGHEYEVAAPLDIDPADVLECPFSPIGGTKMSKYDCNPVFTGTGEDWGESFGSVGFRTQNVLGHPFYQIWYTSSEDPYQWGNYGLGYAVSGDGTTWDTHEANPVVESRNQGWDADNMDQVVVVWDDLRREYVLAYQGYNIDQGDWGIGIKTSPDGVAWDGFNGGDAVVDLTKPIRDVTYCWPLGFQWSSGVGYLGWLGGAKGLENVCEIFAFQGASLEDGFDFDDEPILEAGPDPYDRSGMAGAAVVLYGDTWYMFYIGFRDWKSYATYQTTVDHSFAMATSTDGVNWEKSPDNPLPVALTEPGYVNGVAAQVVGSRIHLWITDWYEDLGQSAVGYYLYEPEIEPHP